MHTEQWWDEAETDPVHARAAEWLVRLQDSEISLEDTLAWQDWMKTSPRHAEAFARLEEISLTARAVQPPREVGFRELARDRYDASAPLGAWRPNRSWRPLAIAASIVLLLTGSTGIWLIGHRDGLESLGIARSGQTFASPIGENRTVELGDGSKVILGGNTQLRAKLSNQLRSIELVRGEAFFVVAKDRIRPFKVHAGEVTVTAIGTEFDVLRGRNRAVVAVTEGRVMVEPVSHLLPVALLSEFKPKLRAVHIDAGEQTTAGSAGIEEVSAVEDLSATTSWQAGRLAFHLQPLQYVLEDVNRYAPKPIVLDDQSIGSLLITGTVTGGNVAGWISSLEQAFGLAAVEGPDRIVIRRR